MIKVFYHCNADGVIERFHTNGHAEYADVGNDIVCASVSVLIINAVNSIEYFTKDKFEFNMIEDNGIMNFNISSEISNESKLLLDSMLLGLKAIQETYGKKHITLYQEK